MGDECKQKEVTHIKVDGQTAETPVKKMVKVGLS